LYDTFYIHNNRPKRPVKEGNLYPPSIKDIYGIKKQKGWCVREMPLPLCTGDSVLLKCNEKVVKDLKLREGLSKPTDYEIRSPHPLVQVSPSLTFIIFYSNPFVNTKTARRLS